MKDTWPDSFDAIYDRLSSAGDQLFYLGTAILQLLIGFVIAVFVAKGVRKFIRRRTRNTPSPTLAVMAENSAVAGVYVVAFTIVLTFWGLTWSSLITALSISTVAVAFGFQDLLRSFVGGMLVVFEHPFSIGDRIKVRDLEGRVERIDLRTTVVRGDNGDRITVPNALILSDPIINRSPNRVSRIVTVSGLDESPTDFKKRVLDALAGVPGLDPSPRVSMRTRNNQNRMRQAVDAVTRNDPTADEGASQTGPRVIGFKLAWSGDGAASTRAEVRQRLQQLFPQGRVTE